MDKYVLNPSIQFPLLCYSTQPFPFLVLLLWTHSGAKRDIYVICVVSKQALMHITYKAGTAQGTSLSSHSLRLYTSLSVKASSLINFLNNHYCFSNTEDDVNIKEAMEDLNYIPKQLFWKCIGIPKIYLGITYSRIWKLYFRITIPESNILSEWPFCNRWCPFEGYFCPSESFGGEGNKKGVESKS